MSGTNSHWFKKGLKDGVPICLGYFAVAFTLGIVAKKANVTAFQAALTSFCLHASAGEYIAFTLIASHATMLEMIIMEAVANARYMLMSCSLSQKISEDTPIWQRLIMGYFVTDEIFGVSVSVDGRLNPYYCFGMAAIASPGWVAGTALGVIMGEVLPVAIVSALSVGLYGMFVAVFAPPARKNKIIAGVIVVSFAVSFIVSKISVLASVPDGVKIIMMTVIIASIAAVLFPVREETVTENK